MKFSEIMKNGIIKDNPIFVQLVGMCPVLAVTTSVQNSLAMGMAVTAVLIGSNLVVSLLRHIIPDTIRIPAFVSIIATFVTVIGMFMEAYAQPIYQALGIFLPLIVVNCVILSRAEAFAFNNPPLPSIVDGLAVGLGFTLGVFVLGTVREVLGVGTFLGIELFGSNFPAIGMLIMPAGAFIALGILVGTINAFNSKKA